MRSTLLFIICFSLFACGTNRNVYKSADFTERSYSHQTIAILPVVITQTGHISKKETQESIDAVNEKWSYTFQESLHSYVLRQTAKNKKGQIVNFQALQKTNAILKENNIALADLQSKNPEELAKLLGVDAVMMTTLEKNKNFSDGVAYGMVAGRAVLNIIGKSTINPVPYMNASDINMNCYLYDADDSKLLWKTFRKGGTDLPTNVDDLVTYYSNWIAKKLPYRS